MNEKKITDYLVKKYQPLAIILHGSRASGHNRPNSDWDIYLLVDQKLDLEDEVYQEQQLDLCQIMLPIKEEELIDTFGSTLHSAKILLDTKDKIARKLVEASQHFYAINREYSVNEIGNAKSYMRRVLLRLKDTQSNQELFFYHLGNFYQGVISYWFLARKKWSKPIYQALEIISKEDPEYFDLLTVVSSDAASQGKFSVCEELFKRCFKDLI
jgi:predicted nucleotidyltransferase